MGTMRMRDFFLPWIAAFVVLSAPRVSVAQESPSAAPAAGQALTQGQDRTPQIWSIRAPKLDQITIHGMANLDGAGVASVPMMYPAPNAVGLLAGIVTHGLINGAAKKKKKQRLVDAADQVLVPYQPLLAAYSTRLLLQGSVLRDALREGGGRVFLIGEPSTADWLVVAEPTFRFSADQRALLIDNAIVFYSPDSRTTPVFKNVVRIVAAPMQGPDETLSGSWLEDDGSLFKQTLEDLYAQSLSVAIRSMSSSGVVARVDPNSAKTIRYVLGAAERMERGQLLFEDCDRVVIRTLYGTIMSAPTRNKGAPVVAGGCGALSAAQSVARGPAETGAPAPALPDEQKVQPEGTVPAATDQ